MSFGAHLALEDGVATVAHVLQNQQAQHDFGGGAFAATRTASRPAACQGLKHRLHQLPVRQHLVDLASILPTQIADLLGDQSPVHVEEDDALSLRRRVARLASPPASPSPLRVLPVDALGSQLGVHLVLAILLGPAVAHALLDHLLSPLRERLGLGGILGLARIVGRDRCGA